jgi:Mrp family chromosome partitioning ATPase
MRRLKLPELLAQFRSEFDTVIIDGPPMLLMPDARVVGRIADAVILVMRIGHTTRDAARAARQPFEEDRTKVLGTILNEWSPKRPQQAIKATTVAAAASVLSPDSQQRPILANESTRTGAIRQSDRYRFDNPLGSDRRAEDVAGR